MYRTILGVTLLVAATLPAQAATYNALHMTAASGTFTSYDTVNNAFFPINNWTNTQNPGANLVGGYVFLGAVGMFYGLPYYLSTGDDWGAPVPTAILDDVAHTIQADLSALIWDWSASSFSQGSVQASGTWNPSTGIYHLAWSSPFASGYGFDGLVGEWTMTGVAVVPEPETWALLLAGLGLVGAAARRKALATRTRA